MAPSAAGLGTAVAETTEAKLGMAIAAAFEGGASASAGVERRTLG